MKQGEPGYALWEAARRARRMLAHFRRVMQRPPHHQLHGQEPKR